MTVRFALLAAFLLVAVAHGQDDPADPPRPVSVQEFSLLLRSGYTGDEALRETAGRPLLAPLDAAAERALLDAGADARTVAALRAGRRVVSSHEAAGLQQRQAATDRYRLEAWEAEQARRAEVNRESMRAKLAARHEENLKQVSTQFYDKLVSFTHNHLQPYDNAALAGKRVFLLYAAAGSDKSSLQLTPRLVEFYRKFAPAHPEFEAVLISADGSAAEMENHLRRAKIPWPALAYDQIARQPELDALRQARLPRVVLIDGGAQVLADSAGDGETLNVQKVLDTLRERSAQPSAAR